MNLDESRDATVTRRPRRARQRVHRQAGPHQPRRQGGEGRPALRLCRAGGRGRPEGPRRLRPRQGARGAGSDPQGDRGRQARADPRAAARRPHAASRRRTAATAPARWSCARRLPVPASSPAARCARCSRRSACRTWWPSRSARPTPTTWCAPPSTRSSARFAALGGRPPQHQGLHPAGAPPRRRRGRAGGRLKPIARENDGHGSGKDHQGRADRQPDAPPPGSARDADRARPQQDRPHAASCRTRPPPAA